MAKEIASDLIIESVPKVYWNRPQKPSVPDCRLYHTNTAFGVNPRKSAEIRENRIPSTVTSA